MSPTVLLLEEFFAPAEAQSLWEFAVSREPSFVASEIQSGAHESRTDAEFRRSRVLFETTEVFPLISARVLDVLPFVLGRLAMEPFEIRNFELQATASNDGEWFKPHRDNGHGPMGGRRLTFVYYCHREPRPFSGGELKMFGPVPESGHVPETHASVISPMQNSAVFFPSDHLHEVMPMCCPSRQFRDSRFTYNGWLHQ